MALSMAQYCVLVADVLITAAMEREYAAAGTSRILSRRAPYTEAAQRMSTRWRDYLGEGTSNDAASCLEFAAPCHR